MLFSVWELVASGSQELLGISVPSNSFVVLNMQIYNRIADPTTVVRMPRTIGTRSGGLCPAKGLNVSKIHKSVR